MQAPHSFFNAFHHVPPIVGFSSISHEPAGSWLMLCEVVKVYIDRQLLKDGVYDTANAGMILRGGGPADHFTIGEAQRFKMYRPA